MKGVEVTQIDKEHEATTTLNLGLRSVVDGSPESAFSAFLLAANSDEKASIEAILNGDGSKAMIFIHRGPSKGSRFLLEDAHVSIGRAPESSIFFDDVTVSRKHAVIERIDKKFYLRDLGSLNGTYINNIQKQESFLQTGDEIQIGKFHLLFVGAKNSKGENQ